MKKLLAVTLLTVAAGAVTALTGCGTAPVLTGASALTATAAQAQSRKADPAGTNRFYMVTGFQGEIVSVKPAKEKGAFVLKLKGTEGSKYGGTFTVTYAVSMDYKPQVTMDDLQEGAVIAADVHYPLVRTKTNEILEAANIARVSLVK